jgi:ATPase family associated with various cellular activities (AAA)
MMDLLPSQERLLQDITTSLPYFPVLLIAGPNKCGKHLIANTLVHRLNLNMTQFDIVDLNGRPFYCQDLYLYLESLLSRLSLDSRKADTLVPAIETLTLLSSKENDRGDRSERSEKTKRSRDDNATQGYQVIYIRSLDRIIQFFMDLNSPQRQLFPIIFNRWLRRLSSNYRVIATCHDYSTCRCNIDLPFSLHQLIISPSDIRVYLERTTVPKTDYHPILALSRKPCLGLIIASIKYGLGVTEEGSSILPAYNRSLIGMSDTPIETNQRVAYPLDEELIGLDTIKTEILVNIISPIEYNNPDIPIKKGLVLYGPPGTGKTSIGRWLAHMLNGRFYLVRGQDGISGASFIEAIDNTFNRAKNNSPAVVFIDDVDTIFSNPDSYRAFLTLLDGVDVKERDNICVIVTCMNLRNIPASLLRGGRLEMSLRTTLPTHDSIQRILRFGLARMNRAISSTIGQTPEGNAILETLSDLNSPGTQVIIRTLSNKMTGWNCADVTRCVNDVIRGLIAKPDNMMTTFERSIINIRNQYDECSNLEEYSLGDDNRPSYCN